MTLLVTVIAAIVSTLVWYFCEKRQEFRLGFLCLMYWGASLMWFVDALFEYAQLKAAYFMPAASDMLNDFFLGISAVVVGIVIWLVQLLVKDPKKIILRN